ncbi:MAG: ABC transporter substrate-binding protein [Bacteroidales bacterium]
MKNDLPALPGNRFLFPSLLICLTLVCSNCRQGQEPIPRAGTARLTETADPAVPLRKVRFLPYWVPSAQFSGYYVGIEKGFFRKHGIDLEILPFDPSMSVETTIRDKKTDFAVLWMVNAIEMKTNGLDIINIAQMSFRSSLMLITKKSSGITTLEDMNGKRAGIWLGYERQPQALFRKYNLEVDMVPIGSSNSLFLLDAVDILNANWFDEYHAILNNGINEDELNRFFFADYGLNFLEDGIYCLNDLVREDPDLCRKMMTAILEGWSYAFEHQEEAIDIVVNYAKAVNQPVNRPHQRWMLSHYRSLYIPEGSGRINTHLKEEDFTSVQSIMLENGCIGQTIPFESFFNHYETLPAGR